LVGGNSRIPNCEFQIPKCKFRIVNSKIRIPNCELRISLLSPWSRSKRTIFRMKIQSSLRVAVATGTVRGHRKKSKLSPGWSTTGGGAHRRPRRTKKNNIFEFRGQKTVSSRSVTFHKKCQFSAKSSKRGKWEEQAKPEVA
jgi:hypothetical protein